ncbi:hypothetical protein JMJ55_25160 [Belnapia sp. T6]|uniref:Lipoprotein n=1 Tax=Belnapia mucosa TaxID=2804532 RepID=A0ABS1VDZ6_9PROT|nr:hypothetical protein [Belnapia mucosa]MBL6458633.1 hypothetical protein [Belnapia mucosa]
MPRLALLLLLAPLGACSSPPSTPMSETEKHYIVACMNLDYDACKISSSFAQLARTRQDQAAAQQSVEAAPSPGMMQPMLYPGPMGIVQQPQYIYTPPPVLPLTGTGGNQVRCITTGLYTNCRY